MSTTAMADILFCIDASKSMRPCIDGVRANIQQFVESIATSAQMTWDLRVDFLAHQCSQEAEGFQAGLYTTHLSHIGVINALYSEQSGGELFTTAPAAFRRSLGNVEVQGDECTLVALDSCLDFPWRTDTGCRRIVILLTDEPVESGAWPDQSAELLPKVIEKIHQLKAMVFMFAPGSAIMESLGEANRSVWEEVETGAGLGDVNLQKALQYVSQAIRSSQSPLGPAINVAQALFGQNKWTKTEARPFLGR